MNRSASRKKKQVEFSDDLGALTSADSVAEKNFSGEIFPGKNSNKNSKDGHSRPGIPEDFLRVYSSAEQSESVVPLYSSGKLVFDEKKEVSMSNGALVKSGSSQRTYGSENHIHMPTGSNSSDLPSLKDLTSMNLPDSTELSPTTSPNIGLKKGSSKKHDKSNVNQHQSFSKGSETRIEEDKDSSGEVMSSGSVNAPPDRASSDPARAPGASWYRDDFNIRSFEEADNDDVKELEKICMRGGIEIGATLRTRSVSDKGGLYTKTHLIVQIKAAPSDQPNSGNGSTKKTGGIKGFGSRKGRAQMGDEICAFGCGAIERLSIDGNYNFTGTIIDLFVHPNYRRRNLASRIFQDLESKMRRVGVTMIIIRIPRSNDAGLHFVRRHGFTEMTELRVIGWHCNNPVPTTTQVDMITDANEASKLLQEKFEKSQLFVEEKILSKVLLHDQFHGGTFISISEESKSEAQVSIFKYHEMYRVKLEQSDSFISRCFSCLTTQTEGIDFNSMCILYCARYSGPDGPFLLRQCLAEAHNKCLSLGVTLMAMVFSPGISGDGSGSGNASKPGLDPEDVLPCKISLDTDFALMGKPISEVLPKLKSQEIFIDPRW